MTTIHVFSAKDQRATRFVIPISIDPPLVIENPSRRCFYCHKCRRRRWAANLLVHAYYDGTYFFCAPGKGCKA